MSTTPCVTTIVIEWFREHDADQSVSPTQPGYNNKHIWDVIWDEQLRVQRATIPAISRDLEHDAEFQLMSWPPNSPDLNQIEHIWDVMGRQLRVQRPPIRNISDLRDRCLNIWYNLSPVIYEGLVAPMPRRVEAVLRAKGGPTRY
ncbi:transposase domain containing protein [Nephila pilipes]|uniref:Transposase domain containing protein n=2 Tax=Nephila pilipes TaxID=299642 RepID=A0A8X6QQ21_NEPPI|nr:transposase domain containing protein [Nephila pilipes]